MKARTKRDLEIDLDVMTNQYNEAMKRANAAEAKLAQCTKYAVLQLCPAYPTLEDLKGAECEAEQADVRDTKEDANILARYRNAVSVTENYIIAEVFNGKFTGK